jgi:hypothetical protein
MLNENSSLSKQLKEALTAAAAAAAAESISDKDPTQLGELSPHLDPTFPSC